MTNKKNTNSRSILLLVTTFLLLTFIACSGYAANYPLEIIQPRAGLDTKNRFYKAYPGLEYNVRAAVIGGAYPFTYELTQAPSGMVIDPATGEITWPTPVEAGSPHSVSLSVTDQEGTRKSVTWSITVTTSGFRFIDAVNGKPATSGGTGTITNPWKSLKDMYEGNDYASKSKDSYAGEFLYFRNGTYAMDAYVEDGTRIPLVANNKPQVWLAYPGESPVLDMSNGYLSIYNGGSNSYFQGLTWDVNYNSTNRGLVIESSANNVTFRKNRSYDIQGKTGGNTALVFINDASKGNYWSFQENIGSNVSGSGGYWLLGYSANKVLIEENELTNITGQAIGPKLNTSMWFIRNNKLINCSDAALWVYYAETTKDIEISYNLVKMSSGNALRLNQKQALNGGSVYVLRNTLVGTVNVYKVTSTNGPFYFTNNVIINGSSSSDKITKSSIENSTRLIISDNLVGSSSDNIIDSNGNLTLEYASYLGTHGYQIGISNPEEDSEKLAAPTGLKIIATK